MTRLLLCLTAVAALLATGCPKKEPLPEAVPRSDTTAMIEPMPEEPRPEMLSMPDPDYPDAAQEAGIEGRVIVEVTVDATGEVTAATVVESSGNVDLDRSAREAALQAKFRPAMKDGMPVESRTIIPFGFWSK